MKIAILTSGILPVPATKGGAVENLTDFYLEYNNNHHLHDITIYSVADKTAMHHPALQALVNHYVFIDVNSLKAKIAKRFFHVLHRKQEYYHYTIEYYLHEAIKHIKKQNFDVILIENRPAYALKLKRFTNAKIVYHLHNEKLHSNTFQCHEIYDSATLILTVSDYIKSRVLSINPTDTKTRTIYNGINLAAFNSNYTSIITRKDLNLSSDDFVMLFSGRVTQEKGIMELIEAMNLLHDLPHIKLLVIGSSFYGNANNKNDFAKALNDKASPVRDRITFTGFIPYEQMPNYLQIADIAVIPSVWDDPFPTTVLEAEAMGLPIISTRRGGIPEEVTDECAILLDTDENFIKNLAQTIRYLYEKRKQMSIASLERSKAFDKEMYAKNFFDALESVQQCHQIDNQASNRQ